MGRLRRPEARPLGRSRELKTYGRLVVRGSELTAVLAIIGFFAGLTGGMLGVGGSIVMIPAMTKLLGPNQHLYQAAAMIVNFFVVVPAVVQHRRARVIHGRTVLRLISVGFFAVIAGVLLSELRLFSGEGEAYLRLAFGVFLLLICAIDLYQLGRFLRSRASETVNATVPPADAVSSGLQRPIDWRWAMLIGLPTGLIAGFLGVGGGVLAVPLQRRLLRLPIQVAIANSAALIAATSAVGATLKNYAYAVDNHDGGSPFVLAAVLIPTAIVGSLVGSRLTHRLPVNVLKFVFFVCLAVVAVLLTASAANSLP